MENRRQFTRVLLSTQATLEVDEESYPVAIQDISLNGALVNSASCKKSLNGKLGKLNFLLNEGASEVAMDITVVHEDQNEAGLKCSSIDIDSLQQLKLIIINESINVHIEQIKDD